MPLVPSWLGAGGGEPPPPLVPSPQNPPPPQTVPPLGAPLPPMPPQEAGDRFRSPRINFNRFARSNDSRSLGKALGGYVRSGTRGRRRATQRMGSSRGTASRVVGFIGEVARSGTNAALERFGLADCVGKPTAEVLPRLLDVMCPPGGDIDQGIAREAFAYAVAEFATEDLPEIEQLSIDQWKEFFNELVTRTIELRIMADIGEKVLELPQDVRAIEITENAVHAYIQACVRESVGDRLDNVGTLNENDLRGITDQIYEGAFGIFESMEDEAE